MANRQLVRSRNVVLAAGSVGVVTDCTRAHSGSNYLAVGTAAGGWNASVGTQLVSVSPGDRVDFGGWLYEESGSGGGDACWLMAALDVNHNGVAYIASSPTNATLGTWVYQSGTYTVPANVAYVYLYLEVRNPSSASVIRFDDGFLRTGTVYFHPDHLSTRVLTSANGSVLGNPGTRRTEPGAPSASLYCRETYRSDILSTITMATNFTVGHPPLIPSAFAPLALELSPEKLYGC